MFLEREKMDYNKYTGYIYNTTERLQRASDNVKKKLDKEEALNVDKRKEVVENYIKDIDNKIHGLCRFMNVDVPTSFKKPVLTLDEKTTIVTTLNSGNNSKADIIPIIEALGIVKKEYDQIFEDIDAEKRAIVATIIAEEKKNNAYSKSARIAGITKEEFDKFSKEKSVLNFVEKARRENENKEIERLRELKPFFNKSDYIKNAERLIQEQKKEMLQNPGPQSPPKTDWERMRVSKNDRNKIINKLKNAYNNHLETPKIQKEYKWDPVEFLQTFRFLEDSDKYNGPFIVSVIANKNEIDKYSNIEGLKEKSKQIYLGKYVFLSLYDIIASRNESKHIHLGLKWIGMEGRLKFDSLRASKINLNNVVVSNSQKILIKKFMKSMGISYDNNHEDLK